MTKEVTAVARIEFRCSEGLKAAIGQAADQQRVSMNEFIAKVLAEHFGEPEFAKIPRISIGRPRSKDQSVSSSIAVPTNGRGSELAKTGT